MCQFGLIVKDMKINNNNNNVRQKYLYSFFSQVMSSFDNCFINKSRIV